MNHTDTLREVLKLGKVSVEFTKKDGSNRVMICTTNPAMIVEQSQTEQPEMGNKRKSPAYIICVYDLEKNAWRSFDEASVIGWKLP